MEVKICGLTNLADARFALGAGADYLGFVLYAGSVRGITVAKLAGIRAGLGTDARIVAVMVNPSLLDAEEAIASGGADIVQVHGEVSAEVFAGFGHPLWRGVAVAAEGSCPLPSDWPAERYVLDAAVPGQHGGTGVKADWGMAAKLAGTYPAMLAGGLNPVNVAEAIRAVSPLGVDVSSGVEVSPGRKDHAAVAAFVRAARL